MAPVRRSRRRRIDASGKRLEKEMRCWHNDVVTVKNPGLRLLLHSAPPRANLEGAAGHDLRDGLKFEALRGGKGAAAPTFGESTAPDLCRWVESIVKREAIWAGGGTAVTVRHVVILQCCAWHGKFSPVVIVTGLHRPTRLTEAREILRALEA